MTSETRRVVDGLGRRLRQEATSVQDDLFFATDSVVVIPLTTTGADAPIARVAVPTTTGIAQPSFAMIDKITSVRRSNLGECIGRLPATLMADIERSLVVFLGLAS